MAPCPANKSLSCLYAACLTHLLIESFRQRFQPSWIWLCVNCYSYFWGSCVHLKRNLKFASRYLMIIYGRFSFAVACIATCLTDHAIGCSNEDFRLLKHNAVEIGLSMFRSNRTTRRMEATNCAETWLLTCQPTLRHIRKMEFIIRLLWESHIFQQP
jgi:hypothetical protein